ncbi:SDR family NAD(P)-dependent oxidoreductase [Peterkaempfera bronchialis]|uniref:SDR family NAD(P)-dependent oxidoreductase n=1 Tax=Peterkaempfera bronchialis TaxID=2126346 RepID=A0A345T2K0_9ACTN|nr:SDR family NAD(P)-dependent oxidoreductase [Peterkaempfera bronchialis]
MYAAAFDEVCAAFGPYLERSLREVVFEETGLLDRTAYTQPALFAVETALVRLLAEFGVRPDAVLGHSIGAVAAAHAAGVLTLSDAVALVAARSRLMDALPAEGAMLSFRAGEEQVAVALDGHQARASVAAVNGPLATVVSGDEDAVLAVAARLSAQEVKAKRLKVSHAFHSPLMDPMLDDFRTALAGLSFAPPAVPFVSDLTGRTTAPDETASPDYWARHVRGAVRFADGVRALHGLGTTRYLEIGPDTVLTTLVPDILAADPAVDPQQPPAGTAALLRRGRPEPAALVGALAAVHTAGGRVDWSALLGTPRPGADPAAELPTYPFQRTRHWLDAPAPAGDVTAAGLTAADHPFLGAAVELAEGAGTLFTGRLALREHPWLTGHTVAGATVLPATALLDLALHAGRTTGVPVVAALELHAPLLPHPEEAVRLQITVAPAGTDGEREIRVHARPDTAAEAPWVLYASGVLAPADGTGPSPAAGSWPPPGAEPVDPDTLYPALAAHGLAYAGAFRTVTTAWRHPDGSLSAELAAPDEGGRDADRRFAVPPAVLDAALHPWAHAGLPEDGRPTLLLPSAWRDVRLYPGTAAGPLRARVVPEDAGRAAVTLHDGTGTPLLHAAALELAEVPAERFIAAGGGDPLLVPGTAVLALPATADPVAVVGAPRLAKALAASGRPVRPYPTLRHLAADAGHPVPPSVLLPLPAGPADAPVPDRVGAATAWALAALQEWLTEERFESGRLAVLLPGAEPGTPEALAAAAVGGLVRSAATEHPGRVLLVDTDLPADDLGRLPAVGWPDDEPHVLVREGRLLAPRLGRSGPGTPGAGRAASGAFGDGTVIVSGASGALAATVVRHLAAAHGVRSLLLLSRSGTVAPGLAEELAGQGVQVLAAACDVADPHAVERALGLLPAGLPVTGVLHAAGVLDDGLVQGLTSERVDAVLRPKVGGAWALHEATRDLPLAAFVLFSSVAGVLGTAGQGAYAAANSFLDALALHRHAEGLPALSLPWGLWEGEGMGSALGAADRARIARVGIAPLPPASALTQLDAALTAGQPVAVAVRLAAPGAGGPGSGPAAALRALLPGTGAPAGRPAPTGTAATAGQDQAARLAGLDPAERGRAVLDLVRRYVGEVLGHADLGAVPVDRGLLDLGLDSLTAVELRGRLGGALGLRLPSTLLFDHPTAGALARHLEGLLTPQADLAGVVAPVLAGMAELESVLAGRAARGADDGELDLLADRLQSVLERIRAARGENATRPADRLDGVDDDELFDLIDGELGLQ